MPAVADSPRPRGPGPFRQLDMDEPICVLLAYFRSPADLRAALHALRRPPTPNLTVVVHLPRRLDGPELMGLLDSAAGTAGRVVLVPPRGDAAAPERPLRAAVRRNWPCLVQVEPEAPRAVVGAMLSLRAGDALALLWPDEAGLADPSSLAALGARWRATWEAPDEGEFHWPPEPDAR